MNESIPSIGATLDKQSSSARFEFKRRTVGGVLISCGLIIMSMYDLRDEGLFGPLLPICGLVIFVCGGAVLGGTRALSGTAIGFSIVAAYAFFTLLVSRLSNEFVGKSFLAMVLGLGLVSVRWSGILPAAIRGIKSALVIHSSALLVQVAYFLMTGSYLDYLYVVIGTRARTDYATLGFALQRFSGLFAEPAHFATFAFMSLLVLFVVDPRLRRSMIYFVATAMVCSLSLSSVLYVPIVLVVSAVKFQSIRPVIIVVSVAVLAFSYSMVDARVFEYYKGRLSVGLDDSSVRSRFYGQPDTQFGAKLFGDGFVGDRAALRTNGVEYVFERAGIVGCLLLAIVFAGLARTYKQLLVLGGFLVLSQVGTPMWTSVYWWTLIVVLTTAFRIPNTPVRKAFLAKRPEGLRRVVLR